MENPITRIRQATGMAPGQFAQALGLSYFTLRAAETGRVALPEALLAALAERGLDAESLAEEYRAWHQARTSAAAERLQTAIAGGAA